MAWYQLLITVFTIQVVYLVLRRLVFSPLAKIPGPKLAALTSWYEVYYDVIKPGQFVFHIQDLHDQYGPIIRITPQEVHIKDPCFLDEIYAPASQKREKYPFLMRTLSTSQASGATVGHELHRKRREALNPFFSKKAITSFESVITERVQRLRQVVQEHDASKIPLNLSDLYFALAKDVVSYYCFGHDENLLEDLPKASLQRNNMGELLQGVKAILHFPWIFDVLNAIPFPIAKYIMPSGALDMALMSQSIEKEVRKVLNDTQNVEKGDKRSIIYELRDNKSLPPSEKSIARLENEGTLLVLAGTDSTARSLAITHFYLLHHPSIMAKLRSELRSIPSPASWTQLEQLPYLSACIAEGNRLSFGVAARTARISPAHPLHYKTYIIPPGTPLSSTTLSVHTDEKIFPDPWEFRPERWLGKEGMERRKYQMAFNKGSRSCVGINLAHAEMFLMIREVVGWEMRLFETDVGDVRFKHEFHVAFPKLGSMGVRAVVEGKVA